MSVPARRPSTHKHAVRRSGAGLLSLNEIGLSVRSGDGGGTSAIGGGASLPATGIPGTRPATRDGGVGGLRQGARGDPRVPLRRAPDTRGDAAPVLPTVPSSRGSAAAGRPPMAPATTAAPTAAEGNRQFSGADVGSSGDVLAGASAPAAPSSATRPAPFTASSATRPTPLGDSARDMPPRPTTQSRSRRNAPSAPATQGVSAAANLKRPSSQQMSRGRQGTPSSGATRSASYSQSMESRDFHRGLVNALQDVLRQQRQGVFPTVAPDGTAASSAPPSRPGTRGAASSFDNDGGVAGSGTPTTSSIPPSWSSSRPASRSNADAGLPDGGSVPGGHDPRRPTAASGSRRAPRWRAPTAAWQDEAEDVLLSSAAIQMLQNIERSEGLARRSLVADADGVWEDLMKDETTQAVAAASAAHRRTALRPGRGMPRAGTSSASRSRFRVPSAGGRGGPATTGKSPQDASLAAGNSTPPMDAAQLKAVGNDHYNNRRFVEAHRCYSQAMELDDSNPVLLTNRAAVNTMLLNYDACVRDCLRATSIDPGNWKAFCRMARAYALLGQHAVAARHYTTAILLLEETASELATASSRAAGGSSSSTTSTGDAANSSSSAAASSNQQHLERTKAERSELQFLERASLEGEAGNHQAASGLYTKAASFTDEPPIKLLRHASHLQFAPAVSRAELSRYLSKLDSPSAYTSSALYEDGLLAEGTDGSGGMTGASSSMLSTIPPLLHARAMHYSATLITVAKASLFCGVHYLNIASSHLQQALSIKAEQQAARTMLTMLTTFEDRLAAATDYVEAGNHADAIPAFDEALANTHETNTKVRMLVFSQRAESHLQVGSFDAAVADCAAALEIDGNNVKALTRRSRGHEARGDLRRALEDLEHAATIHEDLAADVVQLKMRMQRQRSSQHSSSSSSFPGGSSSGEGTSGFHSRPGTGNGFRPQQPPSATDTVSLYAVLGVPPTADTPAIRTAYRRLTLQLHPDKVVKEAEHVRRDCETKFKQVSHAYSILSDTAQRLQYDLTCRARA